MAWIFTFVSKLVCSWSYIKPRQQVYSLCYCISTYFLCSNLANIYECLVYLCFSHISAFSLWKQDAVWKYFDTRSVLTYLKWVTTVQGWFQFIWHKWAMPSWEIYTYFWRINSLASSRMRQYYGFDKRESCACGTSPVTLTKTSKGKGSIH